MTPAKKGQWVREIRNHTLTLLLISHYGRSLRLQDPFPFPLSPSYLPQMLHAPLSCKLSGPKPSPPPYHCLSAQACSPLSAAPSPATCSGSGSSLGVSFQPLSFRAGFGDKAQFDPFLYLDLTLNPDLDLSVSRA